MPKKTTALRHATIFAAYLLVVWGFYRFLFKLPEEIEEFIIKPLFWLAPVYYFVKKEKGNLESVGITSKKLFASIYIALVLGMFFAIEGVLINFVKYQGINFSANLGENPFLVAFILSVATAISEEIAFRGYIFNRVWHALGNEWKANIMTSLVWALIHIPISFFWLKLSFPSIIGFLLLTSIFGVGSALVFARTKNITASILLHIFWGWPIVLFR